MTRARPDTAAPQMDSAAAGDSLTVAAWTIVSRVTGLAKVAAIGAVLGPTFFGNAYQFTNALPNFIYFGFLAGSLFSSLLVPALVHHVDTSDMAACKRVAGGFLGISLVTLLAAVPIAVAAAPTLLRASSGTSASGGVGAQQAGVAALLIVLVLPQLFLYGVVGVASAAMNARRRFALAAAAPALENVGTVAVLLVCAIGYGVRTSIADVPRSEIIVLGLGSTAAVALHASVQWWGARRVGVTLVPRAGWRDAEVRTVVKRAIPSLGQAGLVALQMITLLAMANRVAGGVVGFQVAVNFYFLAIAVGATPIGLSLLPRLSRMYADGDDASFRDTLAHGYALGLFLAVPVAAAYVVLAGPIGSAVAIGRMGTAGGPVLVSAALAGLAVAVLGQTIFVISSYACYARKDTRAPLAAMVVQALVCLSLASVSRAAHGASAMAVLGVALSGSVLASGAGLAWWLRRGLGPGRTRLAVPIGKAMSGAAVMAGPAWLVAVHGSAWFGTARVSLVVAVLLGAGVFVATQVALRSEQLTWLLAGTRSLRGSAAPAEGAGRG